MIKENQKLFNRLNILSDALASIIAVTASYLIIFELLKFDRNFPLEDYIKLAVVFIPIQLFSFVCMGLYESFRTTEFPKELSRLVKALIIDALIMVAILYIIKLFQFSRWALAVFFVLDFLIIAVKRYIMRRILRNLRKEGQNQKYVLLIGSGAAAKEYLYTIKTDALLGLTCAGYISDDRKLNAAYMGKYKDIFTVLENNNFDEAVCALEANENELLGEIVEACEATGTKISVIPSIYKYMSADPAIDMVGGIPLMNIRKIPLDNIGNAFLKRSMDIIGSLVLILLTSPIMLISALIIKITIKGNVIFKQQRIGLNKKPFTMYKLKSMKDNTESETAWSTNDDPRKTKFGAFIRKFSIDEFPQFFNVLKGDMSLVGPRPELPYFVEQFKKEIPLYMIKHQVKPGITGLAQIKGYRGDTSIEKRIEYDIRYIENWTIFLDISILLRTAFSGFVNKENLKSGEKKKGDKTGNSDNKLKL